MIFDEDKKALIFLAGLELTYKKQQGLLELFEKPRELLKDFKKHVCKIGEILGKNYSNFEDKLLKFDANAAIEKLNDRNIGVVSIYDEDYPSKLLALSDPPFVLFYIGDKNLLNTKSIAVVGTRSPTVYGRTLTENFTKVLAQHDITIISGLAYGVDKIAHEVALGAGGNTIAVLGGGFDHIYPAANLGLARDIAKKCVIVTEYAPNIKASKYSFPARNRIIAGLCDNILITEAAEKSGTLYTKETADDLCRDTFCIPGSIYSEKSDAPNRYIKDGECICVTSPEDILTAMRIDIKKKKKDKQQQLSVEEELIVNLLKDGEKSFEELLEKTKLLTKTLNYHLTTLEIRGILKKLTGNYYSL